MRYINKATIAGVVVSATSTGDTITFELRAERNSVAPIECRATGKLAESVSRWVTVGRPIAVQGRIVLQRPELYVQVEMLQVLPEELPGVAKETLIKAGIPEDGVAKMREDFLSKYPGMQEIATMSERYLEVKVPPDSDALPAVYSSLRGGVDLARPGSERSVVVEDRRE